MGLTGIRGLQPARTATLRPHAPALDDETLGTKPKCFMQSQGDALGSSGSAVLGVRSWAAAAARVPRDGAPSASDAFPQTNEKKQMLHFPPGERPGQPRLLPWSPSGTASRDRVTPPRGHHGPEKGSSRWGIGTGAGSAVTSFEAANPAAGTVPAEAEEHCPSWKPLGSTSAN